MMRPPTIVIGFDSCTPSLVRSMVAQGDLPNFARMLERSRTAEIRNERGYYVGSSWPTMMTGRGVVEHGWYTGYDFRPEHYDYVLHPLTTPTLWERCSEVGRRVAAFDVPRTKVRPVNGVVVGEWSCHDRFFGTESWPPTMLADLEQRHGRPALGTLALDIDDQFAPCDRQHLEGQQRTPEQVAALLDGIVAGLGQKAAASADLLQREPWDLFVTVFGESHCVGHQFWHLHETMHPWFDAAALAATGVDDPLREVYRRLDGALGLHLDAAPPEATVIVLLSHGTARWRGGAHTLDPILHRLELARTQRPVPTVGPTTHRLASGLARAPRWARRPLLGVAAPMVQRRLTDRIVPTDAIGPIDQRRWFQLRNNSSTAAVRLNVEGREAGGMVPAGQIDSELSWLTDRLLEVVDVGTGRPAVAEVYRSAEEYQHDPVDHCFADLLVEWRSETPIERLWSPTIGHLHVPYSWPRSGDHDPEGMLMVSSPGGDSGAGLPRSVTAVEVADIILGAVGVDQHPVS
jgi:predicted AlkP superfamily phosphohydrolase/phosphomutase